MEPLNLLDCIAHGVTPAEFLATFKGVDDAVNHLVDFYVGNGGDATCDEVEIARISAKNYLITVSAASTLGKLGGMSTSKRKAAAARRNGRKGGRPRKQQSE